MSKLNIENVNLDKRTDEVIGKGKKIRHIHFSEECALVLTDYLRTRSGNLNEPLFMNKFSHSVDKKLRQSTLFYPVSLLFSCFV